MCTFYAPVIFKHPWLNLASVHRRNYDYFDESRLSIKNYDTSKMLYLYWYFNNIN